MVNIFLYKTDGLTKFLSETNLSFLQTITNRNMVTPMPSVPYLNHSCGGHTPAPLDFYTSLGYIFYINCALYETYLTPAIKFMYVFISINESVSLIRSRSLSEIFFHMTFLLKSQLYIQYEVPS